MAGTTRKQKHILESILFITEKSKDCRLSRMFFNKVKSSVNDVSKYFHCSMTQAFLMANIFDYNFKNGIAGMDSLAALFNCTPVQIMRYKKDVDVLVKKGLLLKDKKPVAGSVYRGPYIDSYYLPDKVFSAVIENTPVPDNLFPKYQYLIELLDKMYTLGFERKEERISTNELLKTAKNLISHNTGFQLVHKIGAFNLSDEDQYVLYYLCAKYIYGVTEVDLETMANGIFDNPQKRFEYRNKLLFNQHPLILQGLVGIENLRVIKDAVIKLKNKAIDLLVADGLGSLAEAQKKVNIIISSGIQHKELIFNQNESAQINQLTHSLAEDKFQEIQQRMKQKGLPHGVTVLLFGAPGTGKTESVYQLARETHREIMLVDLSQSKSMWFGESEKIVKKIFTDYAAYSGDCKTTPILLFNEADGIFSKRRDVESSNIAKTENTIQNIILQELENFSGILIATTNLVANFDKAFERRFLYKIGLSKPDISARANIWKTKLPSLPAGDCDILGEQFDFSGGQIDNIVRKFEIVSILNGRNPDLAELIAFCKEELLENTHYTKIGFTMSKS